MATNRQVSIATLERLLRNKENPHTIVFLISI